MQLEVRNFRLEQRSADEGKITGYAAPFNSLSEEMFGFYERIAPGAFSTSLASSDHDIVGLWSHDMTKPLASRDAGTLTLSEDDRGLKFEMTPNKTSWAADALEAVRSGTVSNMSIGFAVRDSKWETLNGKEVRTLTDIDLYEISPVVFPAYTATAAHVRSLADIWKQRVDELAQAGTASQHAMIARFNAAKFAALKRRAGMR